MTSMETPVSHEIFGHKALWTDYLSEFDGVYKSQSRIDTSSMSCIGRIGGAISSNCGSSGLNSVS